MRRMTTNASRTMSISDSFEVSEGRTEDAALLEVLVLLLLEGVADPLEAVAVKLHYPFNKVLPVIQREQMSTHKQIEQLVTVQLK